MKVFTFEINPNLQKEKACLLVVSNILSNGYPVARKKKRNVQTFLKKTFKKKQKKNLIKKN